MKLQITITTGNAAFRPEPATEIARILQELSKKLLLKGVVDLPCMDFNGNKVGELKVVETDPDSPDISDGMKALLRHAYDEDKNRRNDPTLSDAAYIIQHLSRDTVAEIIGEEMIADADWKSLKDEMRKLEDVLGEDHLLTNLDLSE